MGTRVTFLGPPILQVGGEKFLTRNEVMRSLLGHLGRDRFHSFRGFEVPLVCGRAPPSAPAPRRQAAPPPTPPASSGR